MLSALGVMKPSFLCILRCLTFLFTFLFLCSVTVCCVACCYCSRKPQKSQRKKSQEPERASFGDVVGGKELLELQKFVTERSRDHSHQYPMRLDIQQAYRVRDDQRFHASRLGVFQERLAEQGKACDCRRLFHGTTPQNALSISLFGFRLPGHAGMFGRGIYFADCPLKSWQYTREGIMLLCDVELGKLMTKTKADSRLDPKRAFQRSWLMRFFCQKNYDSVVAEGCVRVPEFVVYHPEQAAPRYVLILHVSPRS